MTISDRGIGTGYALNSLQYLERKRQGQFDCMISFEGEKGKCKKCVSDSIYRCLAASLASQHPTFPYAALVLSYRSYP